MVPVERIELPTFGLQNRCSTAELNRQTLSFRYPAGARKAPLWSPAIRNRVGGRRQISDLSGKGYSREIRPGKAGDAACRMVRLAEGISWPGGKQYGA